MSRMNDPCPAHGATLSSVLRGETTTPSPPGSARRPRAVGEVV